jgi:hypothetical protein
MMDIKSNAVSNVFLLNIKVRQLIIVSVEDIELAFILMMATDTVLCSFPVAKRGERK